jgi:hypothetical protein
MVLPFADADDDEPGAELSSPGLSDREEERQRLEHLLRLARLAEPMESKILALRRLLRRTREPAIVFTEYRDTLHQLGHCLSEFDHAQLHGGMASSERLDVLRRFVNGNVRVLLATDAASEGLNLHRRCRLVINLELPWTPVRLEQRIGRVERLGQQRRVHAVHLLAANTCEEESVATLLTRTRRVDSVLDAMRATAYEERIAAVAIGESRDDDESPSTTPVTPEGVAIGDLRLVATEEATRLEQVRTFIRPVHKCQPEGRDPLEIRPCVMVLRHRARPTSHWAYRLVFEDSELQPLWTTVIGICDDTGSPRLSIVESVVRTFAQRLLPSFLLASTPSRLLAIERERAIANALRQQRARLATALVQPGLFDRRAERAATAQSATLDEALDRSLRRLTELTRHDSVSIDRRLAFGVMRR